jgi:6-phosphogluconate dehydrogenase
MVHNGIEYADMQFIAECYDVMKNVCGMSNDGIGDTFEDWNKGPLDSFLMDATMNVMRKKDDLVNDGSYLVDKILDQAGSKGTGKWTVQLAADSGIAVPSCSAALEARFISAQGPLRAEVEQAFKPSASKKLSAAQSAELVKQMAKGLLAAKILAYAQGFSLLQTASEERGWNLQMGELARIWRGGCIIRARFLDTCIAAYKADPKLKSLMLPFRACSRLTSKTSALLSRRASLAAFRPQRSQGP